MFFQNWLQMINSLKLQVTSVLWTYTFNLKHAEFKLPQMTS